MIRFDKEGGILLPCRILLCVLVVLWFSSCGGPMPEPVVRHIVCNCDKEALGAWVLECVEKAEPRACETEKNIVSSCAQVGIHLHCGEGCYRSSGGAILRSLRFDKDPDAKRFYADLK